ncbi:MAG: DEAD/DEAH box helicase family protein [Gammaproteobacteria bacterium]|nr:DEAD/DEAH box helicase family protein [Gammaproteobacteria bacterium]
MISTTQYQAQYYAYELTKRSSANSLEKLTSTLMDAQVDLNPHQVEAALFAFKSPLSSGAILADEVGLGKTIEAGLVISQKWAEGCKKILIITPSSLRKQWNQELLEKFFLPSTILEARTYNAARKAGKQNPFEQSDLVICSINFAANKDQDLMMIPWDLVVIDEAHRLRNVYKSSNKLAKKIKIALANSPKVLLTATPLQNSLMELYGLVSFIDEYSFGDAKSFRAQYARITSQSVYAELKARLKPICHRTLRRQVLEYIKYTNRVPITQEFVPSQDEQDLYEMVSSYLQRDDLQALPVRQRKLMTLVLRKLLASSTFAIAGALDSLVRKLERILKTNNKLEIYFGENFDENRDDQELLSELLDEYGLDANDYLPEPLTEADIEAIESEIIELAEFRDLATSIQENAKGLALLEALNIGFRKAKSLGALDKVIIFTESRRTQNYLVELLTDNGYADKMVLFNGSNSDPLSRQIYIDWKERHQGTDLYTGSRTADMRFALIDYFKSTAQIMIATEAAAEGVNLQFCSFLVNYDLPWNPQRIEQRIGRCHRYGQKHDVVVINFLNKKNAADQRVYELLSEKFSLFDGVFGASDEVLGSIESGVDLEQRIMGIYQTCRNTKDINLQFDLLQTEMEEQINAAMDTTRQKLLENFDAEVHDKLKVNLEQSQDYLNKYEQMLYKITRRVLGDHAVFGDASNDFELSQNPFQSTQKGSAISLGKYRMGSPSNRPILDAHIYRPGHPLAQCVIESACETKLPLAAISFDYSNHPQNVAAIEQLVGQTGWLKLSALTIDSAESEDHLVISAITEQDGNLSQQQAERLLSLPAEVINAEVTLDDNIEKSLSQNYLLVKGDILDTINARNASFFEDEIIKLDTWADDLKQAIEQSIKELDKEIRQVRKDAKLAPTLEEKLGLQKKQKKLEAQRSKDRRELFDRQDEVDLRREDMILSIEERLKQSVSEKELFCIRWSVK